MYFKWFQLIHAIPKSWKKDIKIDQGKCQNLLCLNHRLIKNNQVYSIEKLKANELYSHSISLRNTVPTSSKYNLYVSKCSKTIHLQPLKQILRKRIFWKKSVQI